MSSCSPGLAHLLPSSIKNIKYGYFVINDTLFPIRVFNCRVILLYKMTLKEREREGMKEVHKGRWECGKDGRRDINFNISTPSVWCLLV